MNKKIDKVNILGTYYSIIYKSSDDEDIMFETCDGYIDYSSKKIVIKLFEPREDSFENLEVMENTNLRHEIIHAFIYESGLNLNSEWARNEEMVDFFAHQFNKMKNIFSKLSI